jgi:DNA-binding NtrC family response regulator
VQRHWIFITGYGTIERAIALMKLGASDYVTKPLDLDQLVAKLRAYIPSSPMMSACRCWGSRRGCDASKGTA